MRLEFSYTLEDYQESYAALQEYHKAKQQRTNVGARTVVATVAALAIVLVPMWLKLFNPIIPALGAGFGIVLLTLLVSTAPLRRKWLTLLIVILMIVLMGVMGRGDDSQGPLWRRWAVVWGPHSIWIVLVLLVGMTTAHTLRNQIKAIYEGDPATRQPHTLEVVEDGVVTGDPLSRTQYRWNRFIRFGETDNLFLLYPSEHSSVIVPKRAFASQDQLLQFKRLAEQMISSRPRGFPVLPVTAPPPLSPR